MMLDTEKFIKAVHAKPTIWKNDDQSCVNRLHRKQAWNEVAQELSENWDTYSERKRVTIVKELQKKWRNLRDYHIKLRKKDKVLKRKANYLNLLNFLDINMDSTAKKRRRSDTDYDSDDYESHTFQTGMTEQTYEIPKESVVDTDVFQKTILNVMPNMNEDPDRSFLISILPDIKSMNDNQKFKFKLETMKLIEKIKYSNQSDNTEPEHSNVTEEEESYIFPKLEVVSEFPRNSL